MRTSDGFCEEVVPTGSHASDVEGCVASLVDAAREVGVADGEALLASMKARLQMTHEAGQAVRSGPTKIIALTPHTGRP